MPLLGNPPSPNAPIRSSTISPPSSPPSRGLFLVLVLGGAYSPHSAVCDIIHVKGCDYLEKTSYQNPSFFLSKNCRYHYSNNSFNHRTCQERRIVSISHPFQQNSDGLPLFPRRLHILPIYIAMHVLRFTKHLPPFGFCHLLSRICTFLQSLDTCHALTPFLRRLTRISSCVLNLAIITTERMYLSWKKY